MKFLTDVRLLFLGIWLGAAVFFVAIAQIAFTVLPQREMAGAVVGQTLTTLNIGGIVVSLIVLALSLATARNTSRLHIWLDRSLLALIAIACAIGQFVIGLFISSVKAQMGGRPIDELAVDDPLRLQFNALHRYSVWVLAAAFILGIIAFFVIANRRTRIAERSPAEPYNFEKEFKI